VPVALYNFGGQPVCGTIAAASAPAGWRVSVPREPLSLRPMERLVVAARVAFPTNAGREAVFGAPVTLRGAFGRAGEPVLSFRLACEQDAVMPSWTAPVPSAARAEAWADNIVGGSKMTHAVDAGRLVFTMDFGRQDPWGYPRLKLAAGERPPADADGMAAEIEVLEGAGTLRAQFIEAGGAAYISELAYDFKKGGARRWSSLRKGGLGRIFAARRGRKTDAERTERADDRHQRRARKPRAARGRKRALDSVR
jgi:hypothetical protein